MAMKFRILEAHVIEVNTNKLFVPGGDVHRWAVGVAKELESNAHSFAPPRHSEARWGTWSRGALQASIYSSAFTYPSNRIGIEVGARVPYAVYVHEGTAYQGTRYIYTNEGWAQKGVVDSWIRHGQLRGSPDDSGFWMPVTRIPAPTQYHLRVRGQRKNPFLHDSYWLAAQRHEALPRLNKNYEPIRRLFG